MGFCGHKVGPTREAKEDRAWGHQQRQPLAILRLRKVSPALVFLLVAQLRNHSYPGQHAAEALKQLGLSWLSALPHSALLPPPTGSAGTTGAHGDELGPPPRECGVLLAFLLQWSCQQRVSKDTVKVHRNWRGVARGILLHWGTNDRATAGTQ